ncbi:hypothetical protein BDQ12DRAFT_688370 [Crucibulum laeve]|uniref:F-box domain-containing protein n=1 Tax=Crucibulum laeve TaxID=68775 RepID=A0A5C3LSM3_9AGAR|nr:hypothetical protein BDQ12DRAFT_688370 [Crucibulum laeve]
MRVNFKGIDRGDALRTEINAVIPTPAEERKARYQLALAEKNVEYMERCLVELQARMKALEGEIVNGMKKVDEYHAVLAPWKKLPPDIWREIFSLCMTGAITLPSERNAFPFVLCYVCSSWRELAVSTQELWSHCAIPLQVNPCGVDTILEVQRCWALSPNRSLSLKLFYQHNPTYSGVYASIERSATGELDYSIIQLIKDYSSSIRYLDITYASEDMFRQILSLVSSSLQNLKDLCLHVPTSSPQGDIRMSIYLPPYLRRLSLKGAVSRIHPLHFCIPWKQLHYLSLGSLDHRKVKLILRECIALRECSIEITPIYTRNPMFAETCLSLLHTLTLRCKSPNNVGLFMKSFILPSLVTLDIQLNGSARAVHLYPEGQPYIEVLEQSGKVEKLHIAIDTLPMDFGDILRFSSPLKDLRLQGKVYITEHSMQDLISGRLGLCLEKIDVTSSSIDPWLSFLECRIIQSYSEGRAISKIRSAAIHIPLRPTEEQESRISRLKRAGMDIIVDGFADTQSNDVGEEAASVLEYV